MSPTRNKPFRMAPGSTWPWACMLAVALSLAAAHATGQARKPAQTAPASAAALDAQVDETTGPEVQIFYVPQEDLKRAPGYSKDGVFLPLSKLLHLADEARHATTSSQIWRGISVSSVELSGTARQSLQLAGEIRFESSTLDWSAVLIDSGVLPWTFQSCDGDRQAFLAKVRDRTYLYSKGVGKGSMRVRALVPLAFDESTQEISFGRFHAPCRITMDLGENLEFTSATVSASGGTTVTLWPSADREARVSLRRKTTLAAPSSLRVTVTRSATVMGTGLEVRDQLVLEDRFTAGKSFVLPLPEGQRFLRAEAPERADIMAADNKLTITPREDLTSMELAVTFATELHNNVARLSGYSIAAVAQRARLLLRGSKEFLPLIAQLPDSLQPAGGSAEERSYECWDALPPLEITLVPRRPAIPPNVTALLDVKPREASAQYEVRLADAQLAELVFATPPDWVLTDLVCHKVPAPLVPVLGQAPAPPANPLAPSSPQPAPSRAVQPPPILSSGMPSGTRITSIAGATASSTFADSEKPEKAFDGDVKTKWTSGEGRGPHLLTADLGSPKPLTGYILKHASAGGETTDYDTVRFHIEVSAAGMQGPWIVSDDITNDPGQSGSLTPLRYVRPLNARYVRLAISDPCKSTSNMHARVPEFEIYTVPAVPGAEPVQTQQAAPVQRVVGPVQVPASEQIAALPPADTVPFTLTPQGERRWRVAWDAANAPSIVRLSLHRAGAWGTPGKSEVLAAPVVRFDGPRLSNYELLVQWPETLEVKTTGLAAMSVIPVGEAAATGLANDARLALRECLAPAAWELPLMAQEHLGWEVSEQWQQAPAPNPAWAAC